MSIKEVNIAFPITKQKAWMWAYATFQNFLLVVDA